jgi:7,8-didemethyl-8-hydroxy-5-deazariboflavin synthase
VKSVTLKKGYTLRARLPIYPEFILKSNSEYVSDAIKVHTEQFSDSAGLVREDLVN